MKENSSLRWACVLKFKQKSSAWLCVTRKRQEVSRRSEVHSGAPDLEINRLVVAMWRAQDMSWDSRTTYQRSLVVDLRMWRKPPKVHPWPWSNQTLPTWQLSWGEAQETISVLAHIQRVAANLTMALCSYDVKQSACQATTCPKSLQFCVARLARTHLTLWTTRLMLPTSITRLRVHLKSPSLVRRMAWWLGEAYQISTVRQGWRRL